MPGNPGITTTQGVSSEYKLCGLDKCVFQGITIVAGAGALAKGTVMGIITASKLADAYDDASVTGLEDARGILDLDVDASGAANMPGNMLIVGVVAEDKLTGFDAAAAVDTKGRIVYDKTDLGLDLG